jgi:hypothetical protein
MRSDKAHDENYTRIYQELYQFLQMHHNISLRTTTPYLKNRLTFIAGDISQLPAIKIKYLKNVKLEDKIKIRLQLEIDTSKHLFEASVDENVAFTILELIDSDHLTGKLKIVNKSSSVKKITSIHTADEDNLIENLAQDFLILSRIMQFFCPYV